MVATTWRSSACAVTFVVAFLSIFAVSVSCTNLFVFGEGDSNTLGTGFTGRNVVGLKKTIWAPDNVTSVRTQGGTSILLTGEGRAYVYGDRKFQHTNQAHNPALITGDLSSLSVTDVAVDMTHGAGEITHGSLEISEDTVAPFGAQPVQTICKILFVVHLPESV